jgi:glycogenin
MRCSYVSILSTEAYLPGVLVLHRSLLGTGPRHPFLLLLTPNVPHSVRGVLSTHGIGYRVLAKPIANPNRVSESHRWYYNYSKLHVFNLTEFDKVVFLDADMLVNANLDELFGKPHMSAVNSGGLLPELSSWTQLNSGLMVVEPSRELFSDMVGQIGTIEAGKAGGDQAFLHAYYRDWPDRKELHLDHRYNMFHTHLDRYHELFGYTLDEIKVLHFIGETKPWSVKEHAPGAHWAARCGARATAFVNRVVGDRRGSPAATMCDEAVRMWARCHREVSRA